MGNPTHILSVDPGLSGALCLYEISTKFIHIFDMPTKDGHVDGVQLAAIVDLRRYQCQGSIVAVVERVSSRPHQGHAFSFGLSTGIVHGCFMALGVPFALVQPVQWKSAYGLRRLPNETQAGTKTRARALASKLWPECAADFKRVMDSDRAESALIARFWASKNGWI